MPFIPERLRSARAGRAAQEIAVLVGVDRNTIYRWEKGFTAPDADQLDRFAKAVGKPVTYFYADEESAR